MYEEHFGLEKRPFSEKAKGPDVFVGPQTAKTMEGFRKALAVQDAVVTVSGPVGTGKTTLVERALNAIGSKYKTIRVGRVKMNSSDILESLLIVLGVQERPNGTIQKFGALRRKLQQLQDAETRVFVLVEDAVHAGSETLAELEALTDAEAGESDGASIVLMGDDRLFDFMRQPELARLQQRIRRRHKIQPLCLPEMLGYLRHGFRIAGGDYEQIFDDRSAELFNQLSEGVPRVANNLVDAVLVAAATNGMDRIPASFVAEIVAEEFGLTADGFDFSIPEAVEDASPDPIDPETSEPVVEPAVGPIVDDVPEPVAELAEEPDVEPATELAEDVTTEPAPKIAKEPLAESAAELAEDMTTEPVAELADEPVVDEAPKPEASEESPPVIDIADEAETSPEQSMDVPHLINDTLPDLSILSKRYATLSQDEFEETTELVTEADDVNIHAESEARAADHDVEEIAADADTIVAEDADDLADVSPEPEPLGEVIAEPAPESESPFEVLPELEAEPEPLTENVPVLEPVAENVPVLEAAPHSSPELVAEFAAEFEPQPVAESEGIDEGIPELTPASPPEPAAESVPEAGERPVLEIVPDNPALETATDINQPESQEKTPEWDRDPTFAQLKPDLDALEQAMAYTHSEPLESKSQTPPEPEVLAASIGEEEIPEITLDKSIETGIQDHLVEEPADIQPPRAAKKSDVELGQIAANIANAKTLDDIDDIMAETLFGTSISMIAAAVTANPPSDESANDELRLVGEETSATVEQAVQASPLPQQIREEISIETPEPAANVGLDPSASQRLKTVRALNADLHPALREPVKPTPAASSPPVSDEPQPIEDQINTSITQTLQALKIPPEMEDEEPEEEQKSGFFSRFRRSK